MVYEHLRLHGGLRVWTRDPRKLTDVPDAATFEDAARADIVVLTVAISAMEETCARLAPLLRPGSLVIDTCSVKVWPVEIMRRHVPDKAGILATHPLFGPDSGRDGIRGLKIVLCPVRVTPSAYQQVRGFLESLGLVPEPVANRNDRYAGADEHREGNEPRRAPACCTPAPAPSASPSASPSPSIVPTHRTPPRWACGPPRRPPSRRRTRGRPRRR